MRLADYAIPWGVGIFLALVVLDPDERREGLPDLVIALGVAVGAAQGLILRWRNRRPELVMALSLVGGAATLAIAPSVVLPVAGLFALWSLTVNRPLRVSLLGLVGLLALTAVNFTSATADEASFTMVLGAGIWGLAEAVRSREIAAREAARRAVSEEQGRIAREVHDVIAHSVSVIVVQAAAAQDVFDESPGQARAALASIERAGRDALAELRGLLGAVRPAASQDATQPQPGLARIEELAEPLRAGGLDVEVRREGVPGPVSAGVELSAYRIVQEALTNTVRHADATRVEVVVRHGDGAVEVEVRDNGRGDAAVNGESGGHGLVGMRERASMYGGTLEAGPLAGSGYRVHARLPAKESR
jgi:signal transduction histidine kinase